MSRSIHVLDKRLELIQPADGFKTSIDAVLLAAACRAKAGDHVLDLGCGVGSAGLCLARRVEGLALTGVDIQGEQIEIARKNAKLNDLDGEFIEADVRGFDGGESAKGFDHIICNPPYNDLGGHTPSPSTPKALAMGHLDTTLQDWLDTGNRLLKHGGSLTLIHKSDYIDEIIKGFKNRFGSVEIIPLYPKVGKVAGRVIVRAVRNAKAPAKIHHGLILHENDGSYSKDAEEILRGAGGLLTNFD